MKSKFVNDILKLRNSICNYFKRTQQKKNNKGHIQIRGILPIYLYSSCILVKKSCMTSVENKHLCDFRLKIIRWIDRDNNNNKPVWCRENVDDRLVWSQINVDLVKNESKVMSYVNDRFDEWRKNGYLNLKNHWRETTRFIFIFFWLKKKERRNRTRAKN